tara:strand:- start:94 stop:270 length:177 start_codon:yes stop_codon:yes gene_type:complete
MYESKEEKIEKKFKKREKEKAFKEHAASIRYDSRKNGIKFWDAKGKGRIIDGRKVYKD